MQITITKEDFAAELRAPRRASAAPACEIFIQLAGEKGLWQWVKAECELLLKRHPLDGFLLVHASLADIHLHAPEVARKRLSDALGAGAGAAVHECMVCGELDEVWQSTLRECGFDEVIVEHQRSLEAQAIEQLRLAGHLDDEERVA